MPRKVAIVIGVRRAAGFQELPGAWAGARDFAAWARQDGFEVISFVDEGDQPVTRSAIFAAIKALVERQDVEQLFLYFAGHGMATGIDDDYWILSAGVQDPSEVINVGSSLKLAAQSQIPHIAVFADACRTLAAARHIGIAEGTSSIFPNRGLAEQPVELDLFYGSRTAGPALEITGDPGRVEAHGVFTRVLVEALTGVDRSAARRDPATGEMVIHAASLAQYLRRRVPEETSALPVPAPQVPDCRPTSALPRRIASLGQPTRARLSVEARLPTGAVADGASLAILLNDPTQNPPWIELRRSAAPRFSEQLPVLGTYGVSATLADHTQTPASPKPIEYLTGDTESIVTLQPSAAGEGPTAPAIFPPLGPRRGGRGPGEPAPTPAPAPPPPETPSLTATFLVDEHGRKEQVAPAAGVFFVTTEDVLTGRVASELQELGQGESPQPIGTLAADPEAEGWVHRVTEHEGRGHFETRTGLTVAGSPILEAFVAGGHEGFFPEDEYWHLRGHDLTSASAVVALAGGRYAALAIIGGFIGTVIVGPVGVDHVSYLPAPGSPFDEGFGPAFAAEARRALALAGAAARAGRFEVAVDEALGVAGTLRRYKHYNPVLGVLAAYAYHFAGDIKQIHDMIRHFVDMQQPVPFDVALLGGPASVPAGHPVVPAYPLLTQGWARLGPDQAIHPALAAFRRSLVPSLWATATAPGGEELARAVEAGDLVGGL